MTTITIDRATVEQALEAMRCAVPTGKITLYEWDKAMAALRAALAQEQAEPQDDELSAALGWPGGISEPVLDRKTLLQQVAALRAALAQQAEPVAWAFRHSDGTYHDPSVTEHSAGMVPLYTAPPQRKPLTDEEIDHITDPQIEDRLARHGIPMPGDPK